MDFKELSARLEGTGFKGMVATTDPLNLSVEKLAGVMTFADVVRIAEMLRDEFAWPVSFDHLTGTTAHFHVGVPIGDGPGALETAAAELKGVAIAEWLEKVQPAQDKVETFTMRGHLDVDGVRPSRAFHRHGFIWARDNQFFSTSDSGKWCVVRSAEEVDELWARVRQAVRDGLFPAALVSTPHQAASHGGTYVICAFTNDWQNKADVDAARDVLRSFGVTESIGYKRDVETVNGVYGTPAEWTYHA
jgi:hypothetical protein